MYCRALVAVQSVKLDPPMSQLVDDVSFMFQTFDSKGLLYQLDEGSNGPKYMRLFLRGGYLVFQTNLNGTAVVRTLLTAHSLLLLVLLRFGSAREACLVTFSTRPVTLFIRFI